MNKLKQLEACGQSPWLGYLKRSLIDKGELLALIERDGLQFEVRRRGPVVDLAAKNGLPL